MKKKEGENAQTPKSVNIHDIISKERMLEREREVHGGWVSIFGLLIVHEDEAS